MLPQDVLSFWFKELTPEEHFKKDAGLDREIRRRFLSYYEAAVAGELSAWRRTPRGSLAEIIILDQFSRNMFRGEARSFAGDSLALALAQFAVDKGFDRELSLAERSFLYMPYMHSESLAVHNEAVKLFSVKGLEQNYKFELLHKELIERFGRYPHRNKILSRDNTAAENEFLAKNPTGF